MRFGKTLVLSVGLLGGVWAQDSSSSDASATSVSSTATTTSSAPATTTTTVSTAMIPAGLSTACSSFLGGLNTDGSFKACVEPLASLTSVFNPNSGLTEANITTSTITSTLTSLCAQSAKCSDSLIRSYLGQYYSACGTELGQTDKDYSERLREMYDYLYIVNPFRAAVCSRDGGSQKYCVLEIASQAAAAATTAANGTTTPSNGTAAAAAAFKSGSFATWASTAEGIFGPVLQAANNLVVYLPVSSLSRRFLGASDNSIVARGPNDAQSIMTPNATTYRVTSLPYLFLQPNMSSTLLCATCTKSVLASYIAWESQVPYALGLSSSPILGNQQDLWNSLTATCGSNFTDAITVQAGVLAANSSAAAASTGAGEKQVVMGAKGIVGGLVVAMVGSLLAVGL